MSRRVVIYYRGARSAAVDHLRARADERGWIVVGTFRDRGQARGAEWAAMWRALAGREAEVLAVPSFAAIADSVSGALEEVLRLREAGCDLYVDDAELDTTSPVDRVLFRVAEALKRVDTTAARRPASPRSSRAKSAKMAPTPGQRLLVRAALASALSPRRVARSLKLSLALVEAVGREVKD